MTGKYPRLRSHVRRRKGGEVVTYYAYDMRPDGKPDVQLGRDYDAALVKWRELHEHKPRILGTLEEAFDRFEADVLQTLDPGNAKNYRSHLRRLRPVFGSATWDQVDQPILWTYYDKRSNKGQAKKEVRALQFVWNWALRWGMTRIPNPATGMKLKGYGAREYRPTPEAFDAIYACAEPMLRDCMDLATATGMRLTDCREITLPTGDLLRLKASKTGKAADFDVSLSDVLPGLLERRRATKTDHLMLLSMPDGTKVTPAKLRGAYDRARAAAALAAESSGDSELAADVRRMILRDCRKVAADLAEDDDEASRLLQHSSVSVTRAHYRSRAVKLKPVR